MMALRRARVDLGGELVAHADFALLELAEVRIRRAALLGVGHDELRADIAQLAGVAHLAAGLRIERSAVEEHLALVARLRAPAPRRRP